MLFNSLTFAIFLPVVFILYWALQRKSLMLQNALLLAASLVFYGWWDYRFLFLLLISSLVDFFAGLALERADRPRYRKLLLAASLATNFGILGFFKYYGFFVDSCVDFLRLLGLQPHISTLRIILPVGISFYTFQALSYTIDIYRKQLHATKDPIAYLAFISFFPQLVAGPIERATNLLPQFQVRREFDFEKAADGLRQALWGMLKKVVIADNIAGHVESIYANSASLDGLTLFLGTLLFAFQIYCDFSGYSDIAVGTARLFGFDLMRNFAYPYFSRDIAEFWRRWHISLSTWFRDYVYIPLGGSRASKFGCIRNILITFTVSGFWHGANWTFVVWGFLNGLYYVPGMLIGRQRQYGGVVAKGRLLPSIKEAVSMLVTFALTLLAWIFFRADSLSHALHYIGRMFSGPLMAPGLAHGQYVSAIVYILALVLIEWIQRDKPHALDIRLVPSRARRMAYVVASIAIFVLGNFGAVEFIYFQF